MTANLLPRSFLLSALGCCLAAQGPNAPAPSVEDVLPASTYACARFGGLSACGQAAGNLPMSVVVNAFLQKLPPELRQERFEQGLDMGAEHVRQVLQHIGLDPVDARAVLQRPMAIALGRMTIEGMGPSVALVIDASQNGAAIDRAVAALEAVLAQHGGLASAGVAAIDGLAVRHLQFTDGPPVFLGRVGTFFVATNSRGYLREIAAVQSGAQPKLANGSALSIAERHLPAPALASLFLNTRSVFSMLDEHLPYEAADFADALGIGRLDGVYAGTTATEHGGSDVVHVGLHGSEQGLIKVLHSRPADLGFAAMCSKNVVAFGARAIDLPGTVAAFQRLLALLPAAAQAEVRRELHGELERELAQVGTSPAEVEQLLAAFGDQVGFAVSLEKGAVPKPEVLLRVGVRQAAHVAPLLQQVEGIVTGETGLEWKSRKVADHEIRFCNVTVNEQLQLSPCYVLLADALWIGSDTAALVRALKQADKPDDSLAAQEDFAAMSKATRGANGVLHLRLFRAAELGWRTVEQLAYPQLDAHKDEIGFGSDALPDAEAMAKALGTSTFATYVDGNGLTARSHGTLGLGSLLAALGAAADEVMKRAGAKVY